MIGHDNTRRRCLLLGVGLSLVLIPSIVCAQAPAPSSPNPGSADPTGSSATGALITAIGAVIVALIGLVASAISVKKTAGKISWDELLKQDTIDAIRDRGHFVVETGISGKLLQESASSEFARVFANGLDRLDDRVIENIGRRGRFVIEGRILDALLNERTADAPRRLWQWMQDDSKVSQMPIMSLQQQKQFLSNLAQAIRTMPSGPENREVTLAKEETSGA